MKWDMFLVFFVLALIPTISVWVAYISGRRKQ